FETEVLTQEENLAGLAALNRELVAKAEAIDSPRRIVLDMDSTEVPVYGQQEKGAYNGHFESTGYHPLLLFNREGDCLAAKLRPTTSTAAWVGRNCYCPRSGVNSNRARKWSPRRRLPCQAGAVRGAGRTRREVCYSPCVQRRPGAVRRRVVDLGIGTAQLQTGGPVQGLSLSGGGELEAGAAGGGEGRVSLWGVVPSRRVHRGQPGDCRPGGGTLLQQKRCGRAVDQGRRA